MHTLTPTQQPGLSEVALSWEIFRCSIPGQEWCPPPFLGSYSL